MHSGGGAKEAPYEYIYIQAPIKEAKVIFYNIFGHDPERVTCTCCGSDYSIDEASTLEQASGYFRNCASGKTGYVEAQSHTLQKYVDEDFEEYLVKNPKSRYAPLDDYIDQPDVLVITNEQITPQQRAGEVRRSGYVWIDE